MGDKILQRVIMPPRADLCRLYYHCSTSSFEIIQPQNRREIILPTGCEFRTDAWFNAFFERYWREYTHLGTLELRLRYTGRGLLRLYRYSANGSHHLFQEVALKGIGEELNVKVPYAPGGVQHSSGYLFFEILTRESSLCLHSAEWIAHAVRSRDVSLLVGYCTFNRPSMLIRNIQTILQESDVAEVLGGIIVVDQGQQKVREHPTFSALAQDAGGLLHVVEQPNFGGSGGFTRFLMEAQDHPRATHVLLMDDDATVEPEAILRAEAFLSLAKKELAVGGHMLDSNRPCELIQSGTRFVPQQIRIDESVRQSLEHPKDLAAFAAIRQVQYNGWWLLAFSLRVLDRVGLPLPLFLRGDDLEFGCRLAQSGVPTVALPGIAVWHESFDDKERGRHTFYELRNYLIVAATSFPVPSALCVARRFLSRLLDELLAYDYREAELMCEALDAYLRGPSTLCASTNLSKELCGRGQDKFSTSDQALDCNCDARFIPGSSHSMGLLRAWRYWLILRNIVRRSPHPAAAPKRKIRGSAAQWYQIAFDDVVYVELANSSSGRVLRRSREQFIRLLFWGIWLTLRVLTSHRKVARAWRHAVPHYMSRQFWEGYLGITKTKKSQPEHSAGHSHQAPVHTHADHSLWR